MAEKIKTKWKYVFLIVLVAVVAELLPMVTFIFATTYYQNLPKLCGYNTTTTAGCGSGTSNTYCTSPYYYPTQACSATPTFTLCQTATRTLACAVCGKCAGEADTCGKAACNEILGCSGTNICDGVDKGAAHCIVPNSLAGGSSCLCNQVCQSGTCSGGVCTTTCSLTSSVNPIAFGNMQHGATSPQDTNKTTITNTGDTATQVLINGTAWVSNSYNFLSNYTHFYNATGQTYFNKKWLNVTQQVLNNSLGAGGSFVAYFDLWIPTSQAAGAYTQTVWYTSVC